MPRIKSKSVECDCPYCPLIKAKLRCENVILEMAERGYRVISTSKNNLTDDLKEHLYVLCLMVRNNFKVPVGETYHECKKTYMLDIQHVREKIFIISFHVY